MRPMLWIGLAAAMLAGCANGPEYFDNHAEVDRNPACASRPDHPDTPVAPECERSSGVRWRNEGQPVDLSGAKSKPADR